MRNIKNYYFILEGETPICVDSEEYFKTDDRGRVVQQDQIGETFVSTVFLGVNHNFYDDNGDPPILFETMIFGGKFDDYQVRYCTWDAAIAGHEKAMKLVGRKAPKNLFALMREVLGGYQVEWERDRGFVLSPSLSLLNEVGWSL